MHDEICCNLNDEVSHGRSPLHSTVSLYWQLRPETVCRGSRVAPAGSGGHRLRHHGGPTLGGKRCCRVDCQYRGHRGRLGWQETIGYIGVQVVGCCAGAVLAHAMFELPLIQSSTHIRTGGPQLLAEVVATFGLALIVSGHRRSEDAPWMVAAWIGAGYWFTASTSFANPAITIARSLTNIFSGIRPADVPGFSRPQAQDQ